MKGASGFRPGPNPRSICVYWPDRRPEMFTRERACYCPDRVPLRCRRRHDRSIAPLHGAGHHLSPDAKDVARLGTGLIGTIAALVLGLLIASAKSSFDTRSGQINQLTANVIVLDNFLAKFGPEANPARKSLRRALAIMAERIWGEAKAHSAKLEGFAPSDTLEEFHERLQALPAGNDAQRSLKERAIAAVTRTCKNQSFAVRRGRDRPIDTLAFPYGSYLLADSSSSSVSACLPSPTPSS